jgi:2-hydroxychromene-2-carboxylate isomerase
MSITAFQAIAQAYKLALQAAPALAGVLVRANPTTPVERAADNGIAVHTGSSENVSANSCACTWQTEYLFEISARAASGTDPALASDALLEAVYVALFALDLSAIGVQDVLGEGPSIERDYAAADTPMARVTLRITTTHFTERNSLTASTP